MLITFYNILHFYTNVSDILYSWNIYNILNTITTMSLRLYNICGLLITQILCLYNICGLLITQILCNCTIMNG